MSQIREDFLWVEKWRPSKVADCVLPSDLQEPFLEYDESGKAIGELSGSGRMLAGMIKQVNQHV